MQRDEHAAEIVVARRREPGPEADQHLRVVIERIADQPALERIERRLRVAAERVMRADHQAAEAFLRHAASRGVLQRADVDDGVRRQGRWRPARSDRERNACPHGGDLEIVDQRIERAMAERCVSNAGIAPVGKGDVEAAPKGDVHLAFAFRHEAPGDASDEVQSAR